MCTLKYQEVHRVYLEINMRSIPKQSFSVKIFLGCGRWNSGISIKVRRIAKKSFKMFFYLIYVSPLFRKYSDSASFRHKCVEAVPYLEPLLCKKLFEANWVNSNKITCRFYWFYEKNQANAVFFWNQHINLLTPKQLCEFSVFVSFYCIKMLIRGLKRFQSAPCITRNFFLARII